MALEPFDSVVLLHDLPTHGLKAGDLGAIVHRHRADAFEVEFVRGSGQTQAVVTLTTADLRPVSDQDLVSVRPVEGP
ncbi:MAG: DUF4926 domain-containing protein [Gemmatimonadales bacterium]